MKYPSVLWQRLAIERVETFGASEGENNMPANGFLLEKYRCDKLLEETDVRMMLTRSHLADYASPEIESSAEIVKILCELFVSLEGLSATLRIAQTGAIQEHNGEDHYLISEEEGFIIQSLFLPAIIELKTRADKLGLSLTVN